MGAYVGVLLLVTGATEGTFVGVAVSAKDGDMVGADDGLDEVGAVVGNESTVGDEDDGVKVGLMVGPILINTGKLGTAVG